jgi:hypothetical protein
VDTAKSSATARPTTGETLARLEERYRHELMDNDERQELRDEITRLQRISV